MDKQPASINLLKKPSNSTLDTILHFAVTGGRFIIILTETIALAAFLYRFTLDRQIIDLRDEIRANAAIVSQYESLEQDYRGIQDRIQQAGVLSKEAPMLPGLFSGIIEKGNGRVTFTSVLISVDTIRMEADASSVAALNEFVTALRSDPLIEEVSIDRIENRTSNALISVAISAQIKGVKKVDTKKKTSVEEDL